jgi:hypothetical protein
LDVQKRHRFVVSSIAKMGHFFSEEDLAAGLRFDPAAGGVPKPLRRGGCRD